MKFFYKYLPIFLISVSIFLLGYILYRSQIQSNSERYTYYLNYIIIISIFIFFLFLTFFLKKKIRAEINIIILALFFSLYLVEGIINVSFIFATPEVYNKKLLDKKFDTRKRIEVLQDERKIYPNAVVTSVPLIFGREENSKILPVSGVSNRRTVFCNELGFWVKYKSDRFGFRNPDQEWEKNKIEYLLLGDSLTHGMCVNEKDTISGYLRNSLVDKSHGVLNLGIWGDGPLLMLATIKEYLEKNKVNKVLWIYCEGNDLTDIFYERKNKILQKYLKDKSFSQNLKTKQSLIDNSLTEHLIKEEGKNMNIIGGDIFFDIISYIKLSEVRNLTINKINQKKIQKDLQVKPMNYLEDFEEIIKIANELVKSKGSELYFVYIPDYFARSNPKQENLHTHDKIKSYEFIKKFVKDQNIKLIDIQDLVFRNHPDPLSLFPFRGFGHLNVEGYKQVAESIIKLDN